MLGRPDETRGEAEQRVTAAAAGYTDVGSRVSGILAAAEEAAEQIRADAQAEVAETLRRAENDAAARVDELTREPQRIRGEAEEYARDIRTAVDSYATQERRNAEEEARTIVGDAEAQARAMREAAQQMSEQIQQDARARNDTLQRETKALEERRQRVLEGLRDIAAQLQDALVEPARQRDDKSLIDALDVERRR